ncbi:hypothetical protein ACJX0J_002598 [Zea mays]
MNRYYSNFFPKLPKKNPELDPKLNLIINIYILLVQEEDCTMREAQSLSTELMGATLSFFLLCARLATGIELSIHSAISRAQLDALSPFNPLSEIRVALWRAHSIYDFAFMDNESNLPKDVIYSLSLSIYGKKLKKKRRPISLIHPIWWNSDFRTISYKRMEIHHFAMKTT